VEIGFATGHELPDFAGAAGPSGRVTGIDISEKMLRIARKRAERAGLQNRISFIHADAEKFLLPEKSADGVYMSFSLELFNDAGIRNVLHNSRKMLKDDGRMVIVALSRRKVNCMVKIYEYFHRKFPVSIDCRPIVLKDILPAAGFVIKKIVEFSLYGIPVDMVRVEKK
jgi:demethylmenaquinone methyltransferase/2-methoxy-6-polyprenyl-1,4-benzoquinol methylase